MAPFVRGIRKCYSGAWLGLLRSSCAMPFAAVAGTPLAATSNNYLAIVNGIGIFRGTGSAVILRPGLAITSAHVVEGRQRLTAFSSQGPVELSVVGISQRMDLAALAAPECMGDELPVRSPQPGEPVWAMGTTKGSLAPVASGRVEATTARVCLEAQSADGQFQQGLMYAAKAGPGYSGGPVVNAEGALVGVTEGIYTRMFGELPRAWPRLPRMFAYHAAEVASEAERLAAGI